MKKSAKGEAAVSACQFQATRLNKLEYRRLQQNVNLMQDNLKVHLARIERQAQHIRHHYTNVVRIVKPNPKFQLWKEAHAYEIAQDQNEELQELMQMKQKSTNQLQRPTPSSSEVSSEPVRPLLLLVGNGIQKPVEPVIDLEENFLQLRTSPRKKPLPHSSHKNSLWTTLSDRSIKSSSTVRLNPLERDGVSFLPPIRQSVTRKSEHNKSAPSAIQQTANLDALYRIALQNRTAYQSVEQTHIEKRKLLGRQFASEYRALKGTIRSTGLVK